MEFPVNGSPFDSWREYWDAGWHGLFPLPDGRKAPPPVGRTGRAGVDSIYADLYLEGEDLGRFNIGLRLPLNIIGIDVDAYGEKGGGETFADLRSMLGPLPSTWRCSARGDGISGIYLYTVPEGVELIDGWPGIDVIQHHHRYLVVPPSVHPSGAVYEWFGPDGQPSDIPKVWDL